MPRRILILAVAVVIVVAAVAVLSGFGKSEQEIPISTNTPVVSNQSGGTPPPPGSQLLGTLYVLATVTYTDGTSSILSKEQGFFAVAPYIGGKAVQSLTYQISYRPELATSSLSGSLNVATGQPGHWEASFSSNALAAGVKSSIGSHVIAKDNVLFSSGLNPGNYTFIWKLTLVLTFGSQTRTFSVDYPTVGVSLQDVGGGGGGGGAPRKQIFLSWIVTEVTFAERR